MASLTNIQAHYKHALQDLGSQLEKINDPATTDARDKLVKEVIKDYSKRLPRTKTSDITPIALSVNPKIFELPSDFAASGTSEIISIEYPIDLVPPAYLERKRHWDISVSSTQRRIWFRTAPISTYRLRYTVFHMSDASTVPVWDEEIIGKWAAAKACQYLADRYGQSTDPTIGADIVDYKNKAGILHERYKALMAEVDSMLKSLELTFISENTPWSKFVGWRV